MFRRFIVLIVMCLPSFQAHGQDLVRGCIETNGQGQGLDLFVDGLGVLHMSHATRIQGSLRLTSIDVDGTVTNQSIANRIHRFPTTDTLGTGLFIDGTTAIVCYHNQLADTLNVATRTNGQWRIDIVARNVAGNGCAVTRSGNETLVLYHGNNQLMAAAKIGNGQWTTRVVDAGDGNVGELPNLARSGAGQLAVAYRDTANGRLRVAFRNGGQWIVEIPDLPVGNAGHNPRLVAVANEFKIFHGQIVGQLDVETDGSLLMTTRTNEGDYDSIIFPDFAVGGTIGAAASDRGVFASTRHLSRSALFGDSDGLLVFSGEPLTSDAFEQYGPAQGRHTYLFVRVAMDPFGLPVVAFVDSFLGGFGSAGGSPICYWRPRDTDEDRIPDEIEQELGTDPNVRDTDGDGRSDGQEVLIDGTNPLADDVCRPVPEVCNGDDDDCDGRTDEQLVTDCYEGPEGTDGVGACIGGSRRCVDGAWLGCEGQITPSGEACDLVDQDCDGRVDESVAGTGGDCDTGLAGICGDGVLACFAGAIRCSALTAAQPDVCNGLDDDCDNAVDEGDISCGVGVCVRRVNACSGGLDNVCLPLAPTGDDLTCDGADNDCDGQVDEGAPPQRVSCGRGACLRQVELPCQNGQRLGECVPGQPSDDTVCDGIDNDCDGRIDEAFVSTVIECGVGACRTVGSTGCIAGVVVEQCLPLDPAVDDAQCDGVDADCDGRLDEDYAENASECGEGACAQIGVVACVAGIVVDQCSPLPGTPDTDCDGLDNDCDGRIDEAYAGRPVQCGIGLCQAEGLTVCSDGEEEIRCQTFEPEPDVNCDGLDDDCDGRADESFTDIGIRCGVGACTQAGLRQCVNGNLVDSCDPTLPVTPDAECDGIDNDCDGRTDESFAGQLISCGQGLCSAEAAEVCIDGETIDRCIPGDPEAEDWVCDGRDEDCDGRLDEDYEIVPTTCGVGACQAEGQIICLDGDPNVLCTPGQPNPDTNCNGTDDDCDGLIDEDFVGRLVDCGRGACQAEARSVCIDGQQQSTCLPGNPIDNDSLCDGIDSDCDGEVDEAFVPRPEACGLGECRRDGVWRCIGGRQQLDCQAGVPQPDGQCDGLDQDCDGRVDEAFSGMPVQCGIGACQADGTEVCRNGQVVDSCVPGQGADFDRSCDGLDDDCDGRIDEDYRPETIECGVGICRAEGLTTCIDGSVIDACEPGVGADADLTCDGLDDDCDGQADEDHQAEPITCGVGACQADGRRVCRLGALVDVCSPAGPSGLDTGCDGIDQDCDGQVDESFPVQATSCGVGACAQAGQLTCRNGRLIDNCEAAPPNGQADICDAIDTDCDGRVDEDHELSRTECGVGACRSIGRLRCETGRVIDTCRPGAVLGPDTICDGVDSDCDGRSDEGYVATATACGVGACASVGQRQCEAGRESDTCRPAEPAGGQDLCDGIDNDCDGSADEDYRVTRTWCSTGVCLSSGRLRCIEGAEIDSCVPKERWGRDSNCDGIDADCDGRYDENFRSIDTQCGVGACASNGVTECVDGAVVDDCEPRDALGDDDNCDGVDDDCDGQVDEGFVRTETSCGVGFCQRTGFITCLDGQTVDTCEPGLPRGRDSACDGIDADCDGRLDERYRVQPSECGVGSCASSGEVICRDGQRVDTCQSGTPSGADVLCDGQDQDCDGRVDEGFQNSPTRCSTGVCMGIGQTRCEGGNVIDDCQPGQPTGGDVSCDGLDNDCDGQTDESVPRTQSTCGVGACRNTGETVCVGGRLQNNCRPNTPAADDNSCDGIDSDCNGQVDEDFQPDRITCGVGTCQGNGITQCFGGELIRNCRVGQPAPGDINCDGLDDDCDGRNDEDFQGQPIECGIGVCSVTAVGVCARGQLRATCDPLPPTGDDNDCDGLDSDCDGRVDEASSIEIECGIGACRRLGRQVCRDGAAVQECEPGRAADNDRSCNGLDDDCDDRIDEDCQSDARVDSGATDAAVSRDMDPVQPLDGGVDGFGPQADSALLDGGIGLDSSVDFGPDLSTNDKDGSPADAYVCQADGTCEDLGGSERRKPIRDGCGCAVEQTNLGLNFIFYLFLIGAIRIQLTSRRLRRNT